MTKEQRRRLVAACSVLGTGIHESKGVDAPEILLWRAFQWCAPELDLRDHQLIKVTFPEWSGFKKSLKLLDLWITKQFKPRDEQERHACYRIVAECILKLVERMQVHNKPRNLLLQTLNAIHAVEEEYPGYAEAGMLGIVLETKRTTGAKKE